MAPPRKDVDWEAIEREYRANQLSVMEIGRRYGISEGSIRREAKLKCWQRELASKVHNAIRERIARIDATDEVTEAQRERTDEEIVQSAAARGETVIKHHRRDIQMLRKLTADIAEDLQKARVSGDLEAGKSSSALLNLSSAMHKLVALERQAFSLDGPREAEGDGKTPMLDGLMSELSSIRARRQATEATEEEPEAPNEEE